MALNLFFRPDITMVKWLIEYSDGRFIIDIGCGTHMHLLKLLQGIGYNKIMGIDPAIDYTSYMKMRLLSNKDDYIHVLPWRIQERPTMIQEMGKDALLLFARPSNGGFVEDVLDFKAEGQEALYISKEENIDQYNDLGKYVEQAKIIEHKGTPEDDEKVWTII